MTKEEAQNDKKCGNCKLIGTDSCYMVCGGSKSLYKPKQKSEPCDDVVSRQAVLDTEYQIKEINGVEYVMLSEVQMKMRKLPSVRPQEQTGHWNLLDECANSGYYCSICQKKLVKEGWSKTVKKIKYCPNCGAKMVEPQAESEEADGK